MRSGLQGVMRCACLFDGTAWALVMPEHLYALGAVRCASSEAAHAALLAAYTSGQPCLQAVPDDGYIMQVRSSLRTIVQSC